MKLLLAASLIMLSLTFCSKHQSQDKATVAGAELAGRWMLTETYFSIGGPGEWQAADVIHPSFVQFGLLNTMVFSSPSGTSTYHYNIIDDSNIEVTAPNGSVFSWRYSVSDDLLELAPPCIEGCMQRYKPVR